MHRPHARRLRRLVDADPWPLRSLAWWAATAAVAAAVGVTAAPAATADDRVAAASACLEPDPILATTQFARGAHPDKPAVVSFRRGATTPVRPLAAQRDVGAAYGLAFDPSTQRLYAAAYHKRGAPFGPAGPGAIYAIDIRSSVASLWLTVPNAGVDGHDPAGGHFPDAAGRGAVGRTGLGDIDLTPDGRELFVTNLADRQIYRYRTEDGALLGTLPHGAATTSWSVDARPFGLAVTADTLYHGVVASAERSQLPGELEARVYASSLDGAGMREVVRFPLALERGVVDHPARVPARWRPWNDRFEFTPGPTPGTGWNINPQPMLTDIVFGPGGEMVLGFRDRYGDMGFYDPSGLNPDGEGSMIPAGDIVIALPSGDRWVAQTTPEYFAEDFGPSFGAIPVHDETAFGGLARIDASREVVTSAAAPLDIVSAGALWFDVPSAANTARRQIYHQVGAHLFAKANGLGDVEQLCREPDEPPPTATAAVTATARPPSTPTATAGPTPPVACVCEDTRRKVPPAVIAAALAHPEQYYGWRYRLDPGKPAGPMNPERTCLTVRNIHQRYHPIFNTPVWRVGCPLLP